ncbi:3-dehydroquinate synthase [bioreactor metagenome]|uniref:3-dehydroquinate synthase n=1 Tax=bioreactor metagenome TaxID=1076179 RepID=A0A644UH55_9ZZZZ
MKIFKTINTELGETSYPIILGRGIIDNIANYIKEFTNNTKVVIVTDSFFQRTLAKKVYDSCSRAEYEVFLISMNAGKGNKNIHEVLKIFGLMEENNIARDSTLIAIGGGVIGDLVGFVASTWLRGMNLVHIPTTLMAMVDSSVGGKVAINFRKTINAIGNYYHPRLNLIDIDLVDSLSDRDFYSGLAEVIKCAIINDKLLFNYLIDNHELIVKKSSEHLVHCISRSLEIKIEHVKGDVRESGKRLLLNYGHTLGHSIEISTEINSDEYYRHGEGVSIGIMAVAYIAEKYFNLTNELYKSFEKIFLMYNLPVYVNSLEVGYEREYVITECIKNVHKDKKRLNNNLRLILTSEIGNARVYDDVPISLINEAFNHIIK